VSDELLQLLGREKKHYLVLEDLYAYCSGQKRNKENLRLRLEETIYDWNKMMGGRNGLEKSAFPYLQEILSSNREVARNLYFFLSPTLFYIHLLHEMSRKSWRIAMTWSGNYCERIVRNLLQEIDRQFSSQVYHQMKDKKFDNRNGRLKKELEERGFKSADELFSLLKIIYFVRSRTGPHDVPPPEPIQARISANQCLPVYIDYLKALIFLGNNLSQNYRTFVSFFSNLTETKIALTFGEEDVRITAIEFTRDVLYREGFFKEGKRFGEVLAEMQKRRYTFSKSLVAQGLEKLSKGKEAILTRRGKRGQYIYYERIPPDMYFRSTI
jgi:hypothetical protein